LIEEIIEELILIALEKTSSTDIDPIEDQLVRM